jgi:hypothetical protein
MGAPGVDRATPPFVPLGRSPLAASPPHRGHAVVVSPLIEVFHPGGGAAISAAIPASPLL